VPTDVAPPGAPRGRPRRSVASGAFLVDREGDIGGNAATSARRARRTEQYRGGKPFSNEKELQLAFGLVWCGTEFDINREANNGRGPVDFKASYGAGDKSLIEFKLASNTQLRRNLLRQIKIYEDANATRSSVKVIVCYTEQEQKRVGFLLTELGLDNEPSIVLIDARDDNKPSASKA
jgi:hypothetical protein